MKNYSYCTQNEENYLFNYHEIENDLCRNFDFTPKRILVIQMKLKFNYFEITFILIRQINNIILKMLYIT